jgi:Reverse transcriptase (RNA-dependent DNA polymerase)
MLRELYSTPQLSPLYRMVNFAYSTPSVLLLERAEGKSILSRNGVRQGDPLSALLFCVYIREVLTKVAECAEVQLYGFFDDLNVVGTPGEALKAFDALRADLLPAVSLTCNTSKSHFVYFHDDEAPLLRSQRQALAEHNVQFHDSWVQVVGAIVGKDEAAIIDGVTRTFGDDAGRTAFFRRVQSDALHFNSAMLLLRHCGVPQLNYLLRCMPPPCIAQQAATFDEQLLNAAALRLGVHNNDHLNADTIYYMQAKLRHGGEGLTSAVRTSPAAYLGSLAAVATSLAFAPYTDGERPLESASLLFGWIERSMHQVVESTPSLADTLPTHASAFFHHVTSPRSSTSTSTSLQRQLSSQAALHAHKVFLRRCWEMRKVDGGAMLAHAKAVSAPRAWAWKNVIPTTQDTDISDDHYRMAARMNLRLPPINGMDALPDDCPLCNKKNSIRNDQWHFLTCKMVQPYEVNARHDEVVNVLYRSALLMGIQAAREPAGLHSTDGRCPDLLLVLPGRSIISDVCITHPLAPSKVKSRVSWTTTGAARNLQHKKRTRYMETAVQNNAELLPFSVETYGGMAPDAIKLLSAMGDMGEEQLGMWPRHVVIRHLIGSVATAVQRGNAVAWLSGYSRAMVALVQKRKADGKQRKEQDSEVESECEDNEEHEEGLELTEEK